MATVASLLYPYMQAGPPGQLGDTFTMEVNRTELKKKILSCAIIEDNQEELSSLRISLVLIVIMTFVIANEFSLKTSQGSN